MPPGSFEGEMANSVPLALRPAWVHPQARNALLCMRMWKWRENGEMNGGPGVWPNRPRARGAGLEGARPKGQVRRLRLDTACSWGEGVPLGG